MTDTNYCPNPDCPDVKLFGVVGEYPCSVTRCPKCGSILAKTSVRQPTRMTPESSASERVLAGEGNLVPLISPRTEMEVVVVKSVLDSERIFYFVHNDHFGSLVIGPKIPLFNAKTVMVAESDLARAKDAITPPEDRTPGAAAEFTFGDKIRLLLETLLFGWVIPNRRPRLGGGGD